MNKEEILELFRISDEAVTKIRAESEARIAAMREEFETYREEVNKKLDIIFSYFENDSLSQTSEQSKSELDLSLERLSEYFDEYKKTPSEIAEENLYLFLKEHPYLGDIHFDEVFWHEKYDGKLIYKYIKSRGVDVSAWSKTPKKTSDN